MQIIQPIEKIENTKNKDKRQFARQLRKRKTIAEDYFARAFQSWKSRELMPNSRMRSQKVIEPYIVDYVINDYKLIIEIDGKYHEKTKVYDFKRAEYIYKKTGFKICRFTNEQALQQIDFVMNSIIKEMNTFSKRKFHNPPDPYEYFERD